MIQCKTGLNSDLTLLGVLPLNPSVLGYKELIPYVSHLSTQLREGFTADESRFLLSMASGEPEWDKLPFPHLRNMPSLQWKLYNVRNMEPQKRQQAYDKLAQSLGQRKGLSSPPDKTENHQQNIADNENPSWSSLLPEIKQPEIDALSLSNNETLTYLGKQLTNLKDATLNQNKEEKTEKLRLFSIVLESALAHPLDRRQLEIIAPMLFSKAEKFFQANNPVHRKGRSR